MIFKNKKLKTFAILLFILIFLPDTIIYAKPAKNANTNPPFVSARCAIAMDAKSKIVLFEKSGREIVPMASTTKIMTSLVVLKYGNLDKKIEISQRSASIGGSTVGYKKGEMVSIRELLYGLMLRSGNDAAIALAEGVGGSVEGFVKIMNESALQMGLTNTSFESPHGLDSDKHYTTAYDLAMLTCKAKEYKVFNEIVSSKTVDSKAYGFTRSYQNINKILYQINCANGVKTGYTGKAGKCLVSSINFDGHDIVIVTLNCSQRWKETAKIFDYVKNNYSYNKVAEKDKTLEEYTENNSKNKVTLYSKSDVCIPLNKNKKVEIKVIKPGSMQSAINKKGDSALLCVYEDAQLIYREKLSVKGHKGSEKRKWFDFIKK